MAKEHRLSPHGEEGEEGRGPVEEDQVHPFQPRRHQGAQDLEGGVGLLGGEEEGEVPVAVRPGPSLGAGPEEEGGLDLGEAGEDLAEPGLLGFHAL